MRFLVSCLLLFTAVGELKAQAVKFEKVRLGFQAYAAEDSGRTKVGLWTPLQVELQAGADGLPASQLKVEVPDNEDVGTIFPMDLTRFEKNEKRSVTTYARPLRGLVKIKVANTDSAFTHSLEVAPLEMGGRVYLTLGTKLPDLLGALAVLSPPQQDGKEPSPATARYGFYEDTVAALPIHYFAYEGIDLILLSTNNREFLSQLQHQGSSSLARLGALTQWVRRGGRLVIAMAAPNQDLVRDLIQSPAWEPPLPVQLPTKPRPILVKNEANTKALSLSAITILTGKGDHEFLANREHLADLGAHDANPFWEVLGKPPAEIEGDRRPLIARLPYGLGNVTFLAFDLETQPFSSFRARKNLLAKLIENLEPKGSQPINRKPDQGGTRRPDRVGDDLTTHLQRTLDTFDVPVISFGWVALLIVIYILLIGPFDYLILKKVFKKLEWTWFTFPIVVLAVSVAVYFTVYGLKGKDLKINKIDLVDFDLRTEAEPNGKPRGAHAYGHTFFAILSPGTRNYTIGIEPALADWGLAEAGKTPVSADLVEWLGRPEPDGPGSYGKTRTTFSRRPYEYADQGKGLQRVPIPVWTSKSFHAAWELPLNKLPFQADLVYHPSTSEVKISGTLQNNLPASLTDVWIFYRNRCYQVADLPTGEKQTVDLRKDLGIQGWAGISNLPEDMGGQRYDPTTHLKWFLFQEKIDDGENFRNHAFGPLNLSWRLKDEDSLREVILFGRLPRTQGPAHELADAKAAPTALWLGQLPANATQTGRPALEGTMVQDTYIRAIIPVRPPD